MPIFKYPGIMAFIVIVCNIGLADLIPDMNYNTDGMGFCVELNLVQCRIEQCSKGISKLVVAPPELNDGNSIRPSIVGPVLHLKRTWLLNKGSAREYVRDSEILAGTLTTVC